jgi:hypothetical protein
MKLIHFLPVGLFECLQSLGPLHLKSSLGILSFGCRDGVKKPTFFLHGGKGEIFSRARKGKNTGRTAVKYLRPFIVSGTWH